MWQFPQYLYLLRDFSFKLNHFASQYSSLSSTTLTSHLLLRTTAIEFLNQVKELFPSFKRLLSDAMSTLEKGKIKDSYLLAGICNALCFRFISCLCLVIVFLIRATVFAA